MKNWDRQKYMNANVQSNTLQYIVANIQWGTRWIDVDELNDVSKSKLVISTA